MLKVTRALAISAAAAGLLATFTLPAASAAVPAGAAGAGEETVAPSKGAAGDPTRGALGRKAGLRIGTAVDTSALATDSTYRETVAREFTSVTAENVMKWQLTEPERGTPHTGRRSSSPVRADPVHHRPGHRVGVSVATEQRAGDGRAEVRGVLRRRPAADGEHHEGHRVR
ncbi:hypothetical protein GCM10010271_59610 [Streptomyces kurssanovii]|nr:hypothetical protein GCM10010271_59610 [Streptomyces kurssanovii]